MRLGRALAACVLLGAAFVGCSAGPEGAAMQEPASAAPWRPLDVEPANVEPLGRDALEKLGYARILELSEARDGLPTIGEVSIAAFLSYLDFRWPGHPWRDGRPEVAAWFERAAARPSMTGTAYRLA